MFLVLIIWGLYREVLNYNLGYSLKDLEDYFYSKDILNWFYYFNIEGFTGLAGLLTIENQSGYLNFHYGLHYLKSIFILIPGQIRHSLELPFNDILIYLENIYPYPNGSIVRSGFEDTYAAFGISGILWFTFILGFVCTYIHKKNISNKKNTILILVSVYLLVFVRGSINVALFMILSEIILFFLFFLFLSIFGIKKIRQSGIKL